MFPGEGGGGHKAQVRKEQSSRETEDRPGMGVHGNERKKHRRLAPPGNFYSKEEASGSFLMLGFHITPVTITKVFLTPGKFRNKLGTSSTPKQFCLTSE